MRWPMSVRTLKPRDAVGTATFHLGGPLVFPTVSVWNLDPHLGGVDQSSARPQPDAWCRGTPTAALRCERRIRVQM
jgi:hypothetical protein